MNQQQKSPPPAGTRTPASSLPRQGSLRAWLIFMLWIASSLAGFISAFNIGLLLPSISEEMSLSPGEQGILSSAAFWGNLVLIVPLTWYTSRFSPLKTIVTLLIFGGLFLLMQGWAPVFVLLLIGRMGMGLATVSIDPPGAVLIQQWFPKRRIVIVNAIGNAVFSIFLGGGLLATPFILDGLGGRWRLTFYILAAVFGVLVFLWLVIGRERSAGGRKRRVEAGAGESPFAALKQRDLWAAGLGLLGGNAVMAGFLSFFPTLMLDEYGLSLGWSGLLLALGIMAGGIFGVVAGYFVTTTGRRKETLIVMSVGMVAGYVAMTLTGSLGILVPLAILAGATQAYNPLLFSVPFHLPGLKPKQMSVAIAFVMVSISAGTIIGPLIAGYMEEVFGGLKTPLIIVACFGATVCMTGLMLRRQSTSSGSGDTQVMERPLEATPAT